AIVRFSPRHFRCVVVRLTRTRLCICGMHVWDACVDALSEPSAAQHSSCGAVRGAGLQGVPTLFRFGLAPTLLAGRMSNQRSARRPVGSILVIGLDAPVMNVER